MSSHEASTARRGCSPRRGHPGRPPHSRQRDCREPPGHPSSRHGHFAPCAVTRRPPTPRPSPGRPVARRRATAGSPAAPPSATNGAPCTTGTGELNGIQHRGGNANASAGGDDRGQQWDVGKYRFAPAPPRCGSRRAPGGATFPGRRFGSHRNAPVRRNARGRPFGPAGGGHPAASVPTARTPPAPRPAPRRRGTGARPGGRRAAPNVALTWIGGCAGRRPGSRRRPPVDQERASSTVRGDAATMRTHWIVEQCKAVERHDNARTGGTAAAAIPHRRVTKITTASDWSADPFGAQSPG